MEIRLKNFTALIILTTHLLIGVLTVEATPSLVNIGVGTNKQTVVINARLVEGFTPDIEEAVENGIPLTFIFEAELRQANYLWNDTLISRNIIKHVIKYDSLKQVYRFTETGKGVKRKIATRNKQKSQKMMLTLSNIPIASARRIASNEKYYIRIKASLETDSFWFPFSELLFFLPFNNFNSAWAESSPLSIDPDLDFAKTGRNSKKRSKNKINFEGTNHVVRSFNK
ncbi:MAG TPA: DUF4390 domain-containing protein [Nitrospinaceae bacterium]|jgi:hypothetical protein|nr:DUF4390 domain-containing protein [Nitrospinaceae bacterium]